MRHGATSGARVLRASGLMLSGPEALFGLRFSNCFKTPFSVMLMSSMSGKSGVGKGGEEESSSVKTDLNWLLRISAFLEESE